MLDRDKRIEIDFSFLKGLIMFLVVYLDQKRIKMIKDKYTEFTSGKTSGRTAEFYENATSSTPGTAVTQLG